MTTGVRAMTEASRDERTCLHLVAAAGARALSDCLAFSRPQDTILFLDAGVLHLLGPELAGRSGSRPALRFAAADLEAHGLLASAQGAGVRTADDSDLCTLLAAHDHCVTWT